MKTAARFQVSNQSLVDVLRPDLDLGESETIALALELPASLVLSDEQAGFYLSKPVYQYALELAGE